jgi:hypothetical protein
MTTYIATQIRNYGTAVVVGVFIGTALTTGIVAGFTGWYAANKLAIGKTVRAEFNTAVGSTTGEKKKERCNSEDALTQLSKRVDDLQRRVNALTS